MLITVLILVINKMDKSQIEGIFQSRAFKYGLRIFILYSFSVVFKSFDLSFPKDFGTILFRGQSFSLMFVLFGLLIWEGGIQLSRIIQRSMARKKIPYLVVVLCLGLILYGLLSAYLFGLTYSAFDILLFNKYEAWESVSTLSYDLIFGAFIFYLLILGYNAILFYYQNWQEARLNTEKLMRENIQARYDVLKSQIDPHFFFNSLSVLTNLVYKSADLSAEYITQLSKCYRYILDKKIENLVPIATELEFLDSYTFLIRIRHQNSIVFTIDIDHSIMNNSMIPPATLQMLVENAVKHNRFSANDPLHVQIRGDKDFITVSNDLRKRNGIQNSTGVGLLNISKRYELITDKKIDILEKEDMFIVKVPVISDHEMTKIKLV